MVRSEFKDLLLTYFEVEWSKNGVWERDVTPKSLLQLSEVVTKTSAKCCGGLGQKGIID